MKEIKEIKNIYICLDTIEDNQVIKKILVEFMDNTKDYFMLSDRYYKNNFKKRQAFSGKNFIHFLKIYYSTFPKLIPTRHKTHSLCLFPITIRSRSRQNVVYNIRPHHKQDLPCLPAHARSRQNDPPWQNNGTRSVMSASRRTQHIT